MARTFRSETGCVSPLSFLNKILYTRVEKDHNIRARSLWKKEINLIKNIYKLKFTAEIEQISPEK